MRSIVALLLIFGAASPASAIFVSGVQLHQWAGADGRVAQGNALSNDMIDSAAFLGFI